MNYLKKMCDWMKVASNERLALAFTPPLLLVALLALLFDPVGLAVSLLLVVGGCVAVCWLVIFMLLEILR